MITGELKNKINALWEIFWTGGITNPVDVVEQMTYLMFIRDLDDTDSLKARECAMLDLPHTSIFGGEVSVGAQTVPGRQRLLFQETECKNAQKYPRYPLLFCQDV